MGAVAFALPADLATACLDRLRVGAPVDVGGAAHLLERLARAMPIGSTAKLEAIAEDRVPPGSDPRWVAESWLARPSLGWSCWAVATLYAALVAAGGTLRADVLAARRTDPAAPAVDFHSLVELHDGARRWVTDPYFWMGPIEQPGGEVIRPGVWAHAFADGPVWRTAVGSCAGRGLLRYRSFTTPLDARDVEALCHVSVTHTGVAFRPRVHLALADGILAVAIDRDGVARLRRWRTRPDQVWGGPCEVVQLDGWADAEQALADHARPGRPVEVRS